MDGKVKKKDTSKLVARRNNGINIKSGTSGVLKLLFLVFLRIIKKSPFQLYIIEFIEKQSLK